MNDAQDVNLEDQEKAARSCLPHVEFMVSPLIGKPGLQKIRVEFETLEFLLNQQFGIILPLGWSRGLE